MIVIPLPAGTVELLLWYRVNSGIGKTNIFPPSFFFTFHTFSFPFPFYFLQENYNTLLIKYAEAENTIDRMRLEAKVINLKVGL